MLDDASTSDHPSAAAPTPQADDEFHWTAEKVALSLFLFVLAGLTEVGGGWLMWQTLRLGKAWWLAVFGAVVLVIYGIVPTFQPVDNFGRVRRSSFL
jgi:hypothetical protein